MSRKASKGNYFLAVFIIALLNLPVSFSESLRGQIVASLGSTWNLLANIKTDFVRDFSNEDPVSTKDEEIKRLQLENQLLNNEIVQLKDLLEQELEFFSQALSEASPLKLSDEKNLILERHRERLRELFLLRLSALPARVIFRAANSWNSFFWINVGHSDNEAFQSKVVAKNSPVVIGDVLIGVIDYVGKKQSLVRLITDSGLSPSVRVSRKGILLAKGEISGQSLPLWRSRSQTLLGVGFNYDFADREGPARDLRTGEALDSKFPTIPILLHDDLLVTTGMDGVFPPGLKVGTVTKIKPLKEGDYYFELEALPVEPNLEELSLVFVLPPLGYNREEKANTSMLN